MLSSAAQDPFKKDISRSVSIGILVSNHLKKKIKFLNETTFTKRQVGITCETCAVKDCFERVAAPTRLQKKNKYNDISKTVDNIIQKYS